MKKFNPTEKAFILLFVMILLLFSYSIFYLIGFYRGIKVAEDAGELAFEAAAQQYNSDTKYDSTRTYDSYGNKNLPKKPTRTIMPKNQSGR